MGLVRNKIHKVEKIFLRFFAHCAKSYFKKLWTQLCILVWKIRVVFVPLKAKLEGTQAMKNVQKIAGNGRKMVILWCRASENLEKKNIKYFRKRGRSLIVFENHHKSLILSNTVQKAPVDITVDFWLQSSSNETLGLIFSHCVHELDNNRISDFTFSSMHFYEWFWDVKEAKVSSRVGEQLWRTLWHYHFSYRLLKKCSWKRPLLLLL